MQCRFVRGSRIWMTAATCLWLMGCSPAADFHTDTVGPQQWDQLEGQYVVVNYFAEWCAPCLRELPELNEFHHQYGDSVRLFGVSFDGLNNEALATLRTEQGIEFPLIQNEPFPNLPFAQPQMLPATYIVTPAGEVKGPLLGEQTIESLKRVTELD